MEKVHSFLYSLHTVGEDIIDRGGLEDCTLEVGTREVSREIIECALKISLERETQYCILSVNPKAFKEVPIIRKLIDQTGGTKNKKSEKGYSSTSVIATVIASFMALSFFSGTTFDRRDMFATNEKYRAVAEELFTFAEEESPLRIGSIPITEAFPRFADENLTIAAYAQPGSSFNNLTSLTKALPDSTNYRETLGFEWSRGRGGRFSVDLHNVSHLSFVGKSVAGYSELDAVFDHAIREQLTLMRQSGIMKEEEEQGIGIILNTKLYSNPGGFHYDYHDLIHTVTSKNGTIYQVHPERGVNRESLVDNTIIAFSYAKDDDPAVFVRDSEAHSKMSINDPRVIDEQHLVPNQGIVIARQGRDQGWLHAGPGTLQPRSAVVLIIESAKPGEKLSILKQPGAERRVYPTKTKRGGKKMKKRRKTLKRRRGRKK